MSSDLSKPLRLFLFLTSWVIWGAAQVVRAARWLEQDSPQGAPYWLLDLIFGILISYVLVLGLLYYTGHAWEYGWRRW